MVRRAPPWHLEMPQQPQSFALYTELCKYFKVLIVTSLIFTKRLFSKAQPSSETASLTLWSTAQLLSDQKFLAEGKNPSRALVCLCIFLAQIWDSALELTKFPNLLLLNFIQLYEYYVDVANFQLFWIHCKYFASMCPSIIQFWCF